MLLRELLEQIGSTYNKELGTAHGVVAQDLLRSAPDVLTSLVPLGYTPDSSGGTGSAATVPWIAVFDDDETDSPKSGIYPVYLFAIGKRTVFLTLMHGVTELIDAHGSQRGRLLMKEKATALRKGLVSDDLAGLVTDIHLGSKRALAVDYEHGAIFARKYTIDDLPSESELLADLERFIALYAHVLEIRNPFQPRLQVSADSAAPTKRIAKFKPKEDSDVLRTIRAREQIVSRKHETLVAAYGKYLEDQYFEIATNVHPRDMTAQHGGKRWLIEAKTVGNSPIQAARDALSQLYFYRYFEDSDPSNVHCVALFNEPIGDSLVAFLDSHNITAVWHEQGNWVGTAAELADYRWDATHVSVRYRHVIPQQH